jgi:hypothetical protein
MVMTFFVAELAALFFVFGKERERKEREPVTGEMRRNAGKGSCRDARLASPGGEADFVGK